MSDMETTDTKLIAAARLCLAQLDLHAAGDPWLAHAALREAIAEHDARTTADDGSVVKPKYGTNFEADPYSGPWARKSRD